MAGALWLKRGDASLAVLTPTMTTAGIRTDSYSCSHSPPGWTPLDRAAIQVAGWAEALRSQCLAAARSVIGTTASPYLRISFTWSAVSDGAVR
jgi:hypothetical protein